MLPKANRLTVAEFATYFKTGKRFSSQHLTLVYTQTSDFHAAVVVGKKVYSQAVRRNRLRRQLYAVLRQWWQTNDTTGVFQCLVKPSARNVSATSLRTELRQLLAEATGQG